MIFFIIILFIGVSLLGFVIYCSVSKRFFSKGFTPLLGLFSLMLIVFPTFSAIYHQTQQESALIAVEKRRDDLLHEYAYAENEKDKTLVLDRIASHNRDIDECVSKAQNPWFSAFSYSFYLDHAEELKITL